MGLNISKISEDTRVYVDANIFLYAAFRHPRYGGICKDFLIRMGSAACTSDFTLGEVFHKLMLAELTKKYHVDPYDVAAMIKQNPNVISELITTWDEMELLSKSCIYFIKAEKLFPDYVKTAKTYNLMATDAIIIEIMKKNDLKDIATNDIDFERVAGIKVWKP